MQRPWGCKGLAHSGPVGGQRWPTLTRQRPAQRETREKGQDALPGSQGRRRRVCVQESNDVRTFASPRTSFGGAEWTPGLGVGFWTSAVP